MTTLRSYGEVPRGRRRSSAAFKGRNEDIRKIGDALGVETVLEGSLRRVGAKLRITAQLIKVADGFSIWSERFDREMQDVFAIQDDITRAIMAALKLRLCGAGGFRPNISVAAPFVWRCLTVVNGKSLKFEVSGLARRHWSNAGPIRTIFRDAFTLARLTYFNPHSFRKALAQLGERVCRTPEELKAWSQNLGHEDVMTTLRSYGEVPRGRRRSSGICTKHLSLIWAPQPLRSKATTKTSARSETDLRIARDQSVCNRAQDFSVRQEEMAGGIGVHNAPASVDEDHRGAKTVECLREHCRFGLFDVDDLSDEHRAPDVRNQQPHASARLLIDHAAQHCSRRC